MKNGNPETARIHATFQTPLIHLEKRMYFKGHGNSALFEEMSRLIRGKCHEKYNLFRNVVGECTLNDMRKVGILFS